MRRRDLIFYSGIFILCIAFTTEVVKYQLTGNHLIDGSTQSSRTELSSKCSEQGVPSRQATTDPQLKSLSDYEAACGSAFVSDMMIFTNMPISEPNAQMYADKMSARLKMFREQNITPVVVVEPDSDWGLVDFHEFAQGNYDAWLNAYFQQIKDSGITDSDMGLWIPFPEPQQTYWNNNSDPDDFANGVNHYFTSLRTSFPAAKTGILLDSQVSEDDQASQLLAYTRLLDNNLVDVAGLQGFPWHPTSEGDRRAPITSAGTFAPAYLLQEVAKSLDTKEVLFNIGTYRHRKAENGGDLSVTLSERKATLDSIVHESKLLTDRDYAVTINIFAQNKYNDKEGVDWSYWEAGKYASSEQTAIFTNFISQLKANKTNISIFDSRQ